MARSQERFDALFAEAHSLVVAGEYQAARDKFLQAVHAAPLVWTKHRFYAFAAFLSSKWGDSMTQSDIDLITEDFIENENEPAHFRALTLILVAAWYTQKVINRNLNTAAEHFREGLDIIALSPKEDDNRQVLHHPHTSLHMNGNDRCSNDLTLKSILCYLDKILQKRLSAITTVPVNETRRNPVVYTRLQERARAGGMVCDCCGKTLEELQMTSFKRCSRCLMVFYCSPTCQREHWKKKGHKQACREQGQIEIGDDMHMRIHNPPKNTFALVKVISCVGDGQWQVMHYGSNRVATVNGSDLLRLRPPSTS